MGLRESDKAARRTRVGASEVGALLPGGHAFKTPADIYARMVHGVEPAYKQIMQMGNLMEGSIMWLFRQVMRERGLKIRSNSVSILRPRYTATPDGYCSCGGVIEAKNVSHYATEWWTDDGFPPWYGSQVQLQMLATGRDHAHLVALLAGTQFTERRIAADPEQQARIIDAIDAFFEQHVLPCVPPETNDAGLLLTFYKPEKTYVADGTYKMLGDALSRAARAKSDATAQYEDVRDELTRLMVRGDVRELVDDHWTAKAAPARKDEPDGEWRLTFRRKRTK